MAKKECLDNIDETLAMQREIHRIETRKSLERARREEKYGIWYTFGLPAATGAALMGVGITIAVLLLRAV